MTDSDAALLYSRVGRVYFDGTGDALDFINTRPELEQGILTTSES